MFSVLWKLVGKRRGLTYNVLKLDKASHKMRVFLLSHVSLCVSGCAVSIGKLQNLTFEKVSKCQNWRKSRTKCSFFGLRMSSWLCSGSAVSMGEAAETYLIRGSWILFTNLDEDTYAMVIMS